MKFLTSELIALDEAASDAASAIRAAGQLLAEAGAVESRYVEAMVASYEEKGPYFVLAPHIALPHAKPEDGVYEASLSLVRLQQPVAFGHPKNDPVELVFALGASSSEEHIQMLRKLTTLLNNPAHVQQLKEAASPEDIQHLLHESNQ
ncbi:PTS sugar transporter subunit IIA [Paenibacillus sp. 1P07SE]|uniref:PTS sugar transporter subunit IIA n=1 Tax=Paenibacillus sp. 1P07SE TaxID=3132209 RepID=UPI0039A6EDF4